MDIQVVLLMMILCFVSMDAAAAVPTIINYSSRKPYSHNRPEDGFSNDHLYDHMDSGSTFIHPHSDSEDLVTNGRNMLEEGHRIALRMDVQALLSFRKNIKDPSKKLSNWTSENSEEACSSWFGVTCTQHTPRVAAIILPGLNLTGTLSPSIGSLSLLQTLNLSYNNLTGEIPPEIGRLKVLRILDLSVRHALNSVRHALITHSVGLTGTIPKSLSNCTSLQRIALANNNFTGTIPTQFGRLLELKQLILQRNSLSGRIPPTLGNCTKMQYLDFGSNLLSGHVPPTLGNCSGLQYISLNDNQLSGTVPRSIIGNSLKVFEMSQNSLSGDLDIRFPVSMVIFSVFSNNFSGHLPPSLANCSELQVLDLRKNKFIGELPNITHFQKLEVLNIGYNQFYGDIPQWITTLTKLHILDLSNNQFSGRMPSNLKLQGFAVNASRRTDEKIWPNVLSYKMELVIKGYEYTVSYVLSWNTIFDLSSNNLTGEIPASIGSLSCLRLLNLSWNQLEGEIPASLGLISTLEQLDLSKNNLSGKIPEELSNLTMLASVNFSFNNLCSSIPYGTQFSTFNVTSFQKNKCLCGNPLPTCTKISMGGVGGKNNFTTKISMEGVGRKSNVIVRWLHHVDKKMSLITLGIGVIIGFGGVITIFIVWKRARNWVVPPNRPKLFYGEYRLPT